jgi:F-type H+-transporting ATPase subunit alpha
VTQRQVDRGYRLVELLKQPQYQPVDVVHQLIAIYAATRGHLDEVAISEIRTFEEGLITEITDAHKEIIKAIRDTKELQEDTVARLEVAIKEYKARLARG